MGFKKKECKGKDVAANAVLKMQKGPHIVGQQERQ